MLKVLVLTRYDRLGASSRVRFYQFLSALAGRGMSFSAQPFLGNDYIRGLYSNERAKMGEVIAAYLRRIRALFSARNYDLIWMEKEALPWLPATIELALLRGTPYVVDLDDAWFHRYDQNSSLIVRGLMAGKIDAVMRHAAIVVAGNEYLADRARRAEAKRVEVIPSVIDFGRYTPGIPHVHKYVSCEGHSCHWLDRHAGYRALSSQNRGGLTQDCGNPRSRAACDRRIGAHNLRGIAG